MNEGISSMNLSEALVASVIEAYLNAQMLKQPHRVKRLNFCDGFVGVEMELVEDIQALRLMPEPALSPDAVRQVLLPPAEENAKRKPVSEAQKHAIYDAVFADPKRPASSIAAEVGVSVTTVAGYVTQYRKELAEATAPTNGNNRLPAPHHVFALAQAAERIHELLPAAPGALRLARPDCLETPLTPSLARRNRQYHRWPPLQLRHRCRCHETAPAPARPSAPPPSCC